MTEKHGFDAVFVGGGVIGLACAWRAARAGARVVVLERAEPPAGATNVAAGMLAPVGELTFGERRLLEMALASAALYPEFVAAVEAAGGVEAGYERRGALHVALDRDEAAELRRRHDLQRELGLAAEWLAPRRCRALEPGLTPSFNGGVFAAGEASVDPRELARALVAALEAEGDGGGERGALPECGRPGRHGKGGKGRPQSVVRSGAEVIDGIFRGDRLVGVRTEDEDFYADAVVLCNGAWSGRTEWLPEEARPPVRPVKGEVVELRPRAGDGAPAERILASERVYIVPRPDGRLVVGATVEELGFDTTVTAGGVHELLREAYRLLPDVAEMELAGMIAGLRPGTPDNLPIVGRGAVDGLILATGHYRNGILLAPLTADAVAATLAGNPVPDAIAAADPGRFAGMRSSLVPDRPTSDERERGPRSPARPSTLVAERDTSVDEVVSG